MRHYRVLDAEVNGLVVVRGERESGWMRASRGDGIAGEDRWGEEGWVGGQAGGQRDMGAKLDGGQKSHTTDRVFVGVRGIRRGGGGGGGRRKIGGAPFQILQHM